MSQGSATFSHKSRQRAHIFRQQCQSAATERDCRSSLLTENAAAAVRSSESGYEDGHEDGHEVEVAQRDSTSLHNELQQLNGPITKTVEDIEKWLKMTSDSISTSLDMNVKNTSRASVERYLNEQLSEASFEKDLLSSDIDIIAKKLNMSYDTIFNEVNNEKLLPLPEKDDEFILPELQLDNLDQLEYCSDDMILAGEILPSIHAQPSCSNINVNSKDSKVESQETIRTNNQNDKFMKIEQVQIETDTEITESEQFKDSINNIDNFVNENFYNTSVLTNIQDLSNENVSYNESGIDDSKYCTDLKHNDIYNNTTAGNGTIWYHGVQARTKTPYLKNKTINSAYESSASAKTKFQPSIIKRKRKLMNKGENSRIKDSTMSVVTISTEKQSNFTQIFINANKDDELLNNKSLMCKNKCRSKSCSSNSSDEDDEEKILRIKPLSYYNQQELAISKALEEVGIRDNMLQHIITGDNVKVWQCHQHECARQFAKLCSLKAHLLTHFGIKPFKCDYDGCSWAFYSEFKLKRHKDTHLKKKDYICSTPGCKRRFTTIYNLASHEKLHTRPNRIVCQVPECTAKFQTKRALETHMKTHDESLAPYVCNFEGCGKRYYGSNALMSHQRCHSYSHLDVTCVWPGCGKTFDQPCRLKAHMRSHTGYKPYACTFKGCKWAFSTSSKLKRHQKKHTNDRKFVCDVGDCHKAFMRSEHLKEHRLTHIEERFFQCHICTSAFSAKSSLYVHIKKHTNKEFVSRARQQKKKKTVEKKTGNKKKDVYCSRVQPVRLSVNKMKKSCLSNDSSDLEQEAANQRTIKHLEENENIADKGLSLSSSLLPKKVSRNVYFCPVDPCTKWYPLKSSLRSHLQKEHITPLAEIQNSSLTRVLSSSPVSQGGLIMYNLADYSLSKRGDQVMATSFEAAPDDRAAKFVNYNNTVVHTTESPAYLAVQDIENVVGKHCGDNEGAARTTFTRTDVLNLKPNRKVVDSSVGASDVVLGGADFGDDLLLSNDLPSMYCQEDIGVPGYQILLLDTNPTDSDINIRDLD
ncbi:PREDICTED: zinc finger protein 836-like [Ceratosolen solmsi marchali]|uniref:Zinc finger protein 836-like n=1 Tax=Ceratosolen solmsi marchali TaxID=326594 RepID=A0AAJ6YIN7_9HYME|nr:PREDICTED: zinc finger protein 836-like [Ceratosolen solmsi marchali]